MVMYYSQPEINNYLIKVHPTARPETVRDYCTDWIMLHKPLRGEGSAEVTHVCENIRC